MINRWIGLLLLAIVAFSCSVTYPEPDKSYTRLIGPKGGHLIFYDDYENDSHAQLQPFSELTFAPLSVKESYAINIYHLPAPPDSLLLTNLTDGSVESEPFINNIMYFIPIYRSSGYDLSDSTSLNIYVPFDGTVTMRLYTQHSSDSAWWPYRVKIPKNGEWASGDIYIQQEANSGYPTGYAEDDVYQLIQGERVDSASVAVKSYSNWQRINSFNRLNNSVTFNIDNLNYIFFMSRVKPDNISN